MVVVEVEFRYYATFGQKFYKCSRINHFAEACRNILAQRVQNFEEMKIWGLNIGDIYLNVSAIKNKPNEWNQEIKIENNNLNITVDTGKQANILPHSIFKEMSVKDTSLKKTENRLISYTGKKILFVKEELYIMNNIFFSLFI